MEEKQKELREKIAFSDEMAMIEENAMFDHHQQKNSYRFVDMLSVQDQDFSSTTSSSIFDDFLQNMIPPPPPTVPEYSEVVESKKEEPKKTKGTQICVHDKE
ncbi:hypothetical protein C2S52_005700 [Perilla frutescens var. hirtella]|uniref:Uncharacterized protein n=1 Tax=Perilla frutescens var. hirtella TaxID=608512 RepID=A0AAD4JFV3_PERFH|nr:hypothetical protein C2S51_010033 [Perilla frutescens var. frutescens]KAH6795223.1 hypothetical protein C2S52_005700 [Perilla frutescens var. hirtella]KAH6833071.1 hypothetical protein C2S53_005019 [Perilla frutescens var. hirtella]